MEQAILALVSFSVTLTLYLDRQRRADLRAGFAALNSRIDGVAERLDKRIDDLGDQLNTRINDLGDQLNTRIDGVAERLEKRIDGVAERLDKRIDGVGDQLNTRINELNRSVIELSNKTGQVEGRTEVLVGD